MTFSAGVLYSVQEMLTLAKEKAMSPEQFCASFKTFVVASATDVLTMAQRCNWIALSLDCSMAVTERGRLLLDGHSRETVLRMQIKHAIETLQPAWAQRLRNGRQEIKNYLPPEVRQCFQEAGLMDDWDDQLVDWWDELAQAARAKKNDELLATGRRAERLSVEYELKRTNFRPRWQALESNFSGFDLLSRIDCDDESLLRIEVKGTTLSKKEAYFKITRNEWNVAASSGSYSFHIWLLSHTPPTLIAKPHTDIEPHIPSDRGCGRWSDVQIRVAEL